MPLGGVARHNRERERGAALVEAALVLPFVALLVFATVELGMVFRSATVAANASRAGAREMASTYPNATPAQQTSVLTRVTVVVEEALRDRSSTDTPQELRIYQAGADGQPTDASGPCNTRCVTYTWNQASTTWVYSAGTWPDPVACGTTMDRVGVSIRLSHGGSVGPWRFTRPINERTVMHLEPSVLCA